MRVATIGRSRPPAHDHHAVALDRDLREVIQGEVRFDDGSRALYAADASNYRQVPIGVVVPRETEDIVQAMAVARAHDAPVLLRGGGTSLSGQCCNVALVIDTSKYLHHVLALDPSARRARVQPGTIFDDLRKQAWPHRLTFGPDPATHDHCTLGGMLGNNSCGVHAVLSEFYGPGPRTEHHVEALDVLTYDGLRLRVGPTSDTELERIVAEGGRRGEIYAGLKRLRDRYADHIRRGFPPIQRRVSGYNLPALLPENGFNVAHALVGSESTCAAILEATFSLMWNAPERVLVVLGYPSVYEAADHIPEIREHRPVGLEGIDHLLIEFIEKKGIKQEDLKLLPEGRGFLFVEFGADTRADAGERAQALVDALRRDRHAPTIKLFEDPSEQKRLWEVRESGLGATAFVPGMPDTWPGWEDSAVAPERLGGYLRDLRHLFSRHGYRPSLYGHFGQGCVHCRVDFNVTTAAGLDNYRAFTQEAAELVVRYGGSLSGEHGDGQSRGDLLPVMFGPELMQAFREFKAIWDPRGRMNPGKLIDAHSRTADLRLGTTYRPHIPKTHFHFPEDGGDFAHATLRCVGIGKCRRMEGAPDAETMCPSFMVLREEKHTTRGRAHMLFEMLQGQEIDKGWRSEPVKEALDLCLSCKGCKGDCPVNVDMATYKAEFLSHYWDGRLRPRHAYAFGLIFQWARLAALVPRVANFFTQTPGLSAVAKAVAGMAQQRRVPTFADEPFTAWFRGRAPRTAGRKPVVLWPDTFNNYFYPDTAKAAVEVLEAAGYDVHVPDAPLCCGRPLYDYGMLDRAKRQLHEILDTLRPEIEAGVPVVGLEPSCVSVFRDEMPNLLPHDQDARRLRQQVYLLSEFLEKKAKHWTPPRFDRKAVVHGHCHQKSVLGMAAEESVLKKMGLDFEVLHSGCCGMAGSFGFEPDKYDVSMKVGERVLLPAVRHAAKDTLIMSDGFSCRTQIAQSTDRHALHLADVLYMAMEAERGRTLERQYPEAAVGALAGGNGHRANGHRVRTATLVGLGTLAAGGALAWGLRARKAP